MRWLRSIIADLHARWWLWRFERRVMHNPEKWYEGARLNTRRLTGKDSL